MGRNFKKISDYKAALEICEDMVFILNDQLENEVCYLKTDEGSESNPASLIFIDIPLFTTFNPLVKNGFLEAVSYADAINFTSDNGYVRITLAFVDTYTREWDTKITEFKPRKV